MNELRVDIDTDTAKGRYANLALIGHTKNEFFFDFALLHPQNSAVVISRILSSPQHAKALLRSLAENVQRYEDTYGHIPEPPEPNPA